MRNPPVKLAIWGGFAVAGTLMVVIATSGMRDDGPQDVWRTVAAIGGFTLAVIAGILAIKAGLHAIGRARLLAGRDVIASWRVPHGDWEAFRAYDAERVASGLNLLNDFTPRRETPAEGVAVIAGRKSILIDDSYHVLRKGGLPELRGVQALAPGEQLRCIEFSIAYPKRTGVTYMTLRFPYPRTAQAEARAVLDHFAPLLAPREAPALRNPGLSIGLALTLAAGAALAATYGLRHLLVDGVAGEPGTIDLALGIAGVIVAPVALLFALLVGVLARRRRAG